MSSTLERPSYRRAGLAKLCNPVEITLLYIHPDLTVLLRTHGSPRRAPQGDRQVSYRMDEGALLARERSASERVQAGVRRVRPWTRSQAGTGATRSSLRRESVTAGEIRETMGGRIARGRIGCATYPDTGGMRVAALRSPRHEMQKMQAATLGHVACRNVARRRRRPGAAGQNHSGVASLERSIEPRPKGQGSIDGRNRFDAVIQLPPRRSAAGEKSRGPSLAPKSYIGSLLSSPSTK